MTTSQTSYFDEVLNEKSAIPEGKYAYFRERLRNRLYNFIIKEFVKKESLGKMSRADLARRLNKKPEQITRWLSVPGNWTLDTVSDLALAIYGGELEFSATSLSESLGPRNSDQVSLLQTTATFDGSMRNVVPVTFGTSTVKPFEVHQEVASA